MGTVDREFDLREDKLNTVNPGNCKRKNCEGPKRAPASSLEIGTHGEG